MSQYALIIDDYPANVEALSILLKQNGVTPIYIPYIDALPANLMAVERVEVVFLDLEMPARSGFEVLHEIKALDRFKDVPIVAYTVHTSEQNEAKLAGFHSFLGKPLDVNRFPDQLRRILDGIPVWEV